MNESNKIPLINKISSGMISVCMGFFTFGGLAIAVDRLTVDASFLARMLLFMTPVFGIISTYGYYQIIMKYVWGKE